MRPVDHCLSQLLKEYRSGLLKTEQYPIDASLDTLAFAVLHILDEHGRKVSRREALIALISDSLKHVERIYSGTFLNPAWELAEVFPLTLARLFLEEPQTFPDDRAGPYYLVDHDQSDVRMHSYRTLWFFRKQLNRKRVLQALFKNIADTLGYVEHAIGLARALFDSDEAFFQAAARFELSDFEDQFQNRLEQCSNEGRLASYMNLYLPLETAVRGKVEEVMFSEQECTL